MLRPGTLLAGRYRLVERIGAGGMGEVWRATYDVLGRTVAVKVMRPELIEDPIAVQRFRAEARAMAAIQPPGVVHVHNFVIDGTAGALLIMDYVDGQRLASILLRERKLSPRRAMELVA